MVHASSVSDSKIKTFEDEVWEDLTEKVARAALNKKKRTVLYGMWHSARIEDMTMNLLIAEKEQIIDCEGWKDKLSATIYGTGNALNAEQILTFSQEISIENLKGYRNAVAKQTRAIVRSLAFADSKKKVSQEGLKRILELGGVVRDDDALHKTQPGPYQRIFGSEKESASILNSTSSTVNFHIQWNPLPFHFSPSIDKNNKES